MPNLDEFVVALILSVILFILEWILNSFRALRAFAMSVIYFLLYWLLHYILQPFQNEYEMINESLNIAVAAFFLFLGKIRDTASFKSAVLVSALGLFAFIPAVLFLHASFGVPNEGGAAYQDSSRNAFEAYREFLSSYKPRLSTETPYFGLVYVDEDDIPELVVATGSSHVHTVQLYCHFQGRVSNLGSFFEYGALTYAPRKNRWLSMHWINRAGYEGTYYRINHGTTEVIGVVMENENIGDKYAVNGVDSSKEEFEQAQREFSGGFEMEIFTVCVQGYELNQSNLDAVFSDAYNAA